MRRPLVAVPGRFSASASALRYGALVNAQALLRLVFAAGGEPVTLLPHAPAGVADRVVRPPLMVVVEAMRQDFDEGWGQCLAALLACQAANGEWPPAVHGVVSTGLLWEFGRLQGQRFVRVSARRLEHAPSMAG